MATQSLLSIEVGSTYTKLCVFRERARSLEFVGRWATRTTADEGDVGIAVDRLLGQAARLGVTGREPVALSSSAAGGLRIAVSGLTPTLSTKVGTEIALGAGGVVAFSASGRITDADVEAVTRSRPGLVLVCGGTDGGDRDTVLANVAALAGVPTDAVFVYAGNRNARAEAGALLAAAGRRHVLVDNVYPESDVFRFDDVRELVREVYEEDVAKAPGVDALRERFRTGCVPTPLAVSRAVRAIGEKVGGLLAVDVGGATTDVHSYRRHDARDDVVHATFEPDLKRTVEGDLGLFHNLHNLLENGEEAPAGSEPVQEPRFVRTFAVRAAERGLSRHCGRAVQVHDGHGLRQVVHGADLRRVSTVLMTGGALRNGPPDLLAGPLARLRDRALVPVDVRTWLVDREYLLASLGAFIPQRQDLVSRFIDNGLEDGTWS